MSKLCPSGQNGKLDNIKWPQNLDKTSRFVELPQCSISLFSFASLRNLVVVYYIINVALFGSHIVDIYFCVLLYNR